MIDTDKIGTNACDITPILYSTDILASIDHFKKKLGWAVAWEWGEPVEFACVRLDNMSIFLCLESQGQTGTWLMIFIDNLDSYYEAVRNAGAVIRKEPTNYPWGVREFLVDLPDGHVIRFGGVIGPEDDKDQPTDS